MDKTQIEKDYIRSVLDLYNIEVKICKKYLLDLALLDPLRKEFKALLDILDVPKTKNQKV